MSNGAYVNIPESAIMEQVAVYLDEVKDALSKEVLKRSKRTSAFADRSGKLRKSGKRRKSKFNRDELVVGFSAPHAHLIEHGHILVKKDRVIGHVQARPFLGPARDSVVADMPNIIARVVPPEVQVGG